VEEGTQTRLEGQYVGFSWTPDGTAYVATTVLGPLWWGGAKLTTEHVTLLSGDRTTLSGVAGHYIADVGAKSSLFWTHDAEVWPLVTGPNGEPAKHIIDRLTTSYPRLSPDERWVLYSSNRSGTPQVYVNSMTTPSVSPRQVTPDGGEEGLWTPEGDEIVFRLLDAWYAITVSGRETLSFSKPQFLFSGPYLQVADTSHDVIQGRQHLLLKGSSESFAAGLEVITNIRRAIQNRSVQGR
jgi:hypothetical protein